MSVDPTNPPSRFVIALAVGPPTGSPPADGTSAVGTSIGSTPTDDTLTGVTSTDGTLASDLLIVGTPADDTLASGTSTGSTSTIGTPADGTPADSTSTDGTPADGTFTGVTSTDGTLASGLLIVGGASTGGTLAGVMPIAGSFNGGMFTGGTLADGTLADGTLIADVLVPLLNSRSSAWTIHRRCPPNPPARIGFGSSVTTASTVTVRPNDSRSGCVCTWCARQAPAAPNPAVASIVANPATATTRHRSRLCAIAHSSTTHAPIATTTAPTASTSPANHPRDTATIVAAQQPSAAGTRRMSRTWRSVSSAISS
ncbi:MULTISPECIES: hypothetical protein [unclassified Nocardia]|uniref:hypothetical protein n=1 Tax=unclassified Nocardia TaxID=2637762 RepID=UPI0033AAC0CE